MAYYTDDATQQMVTGGTSPVQAAGITAHANPAVESPVNPIIARAFAMSAVPQEAY